MLHFCVYFSDLFFFADAILGATVAVNMPKMILTTTTKAKTENATIK
jgi:hypothetical protein